MTYQQEEPKQPRPEHLLGFLGALLTLLAAVIALRRSNETGSQQT